MSALAKIEAPLDPIRTFMPDIGQDEYERRARLRSFRDAATGMIALTRCDLARKLAWEAIEHSTPFLYAPSPPEGLDALNLLCSRLLKTAMTAEAFDDFLREADDEG